MKILLDEDLRTGRVEASAITLAWVLWATLGARTDSVESHAAGTLSGCEAEIRLSAGADESARQAEGLPHLATQTFICLGGPPRAMGTPSRSRLRKVYLIDSVAVAGVVRQNAKRSREGGERLQLGFFHRL